MRVPKQGYCSVSFNSCADCRLPFTSQWPRERCDACAVQRKRQVSKQSRPEQSERRRAAMLACKPKYFCLTCRAEIGQATGDKRRKWCSARCKPSTGKVAGDGPSRAKAYGVERRYFNAMRVFARDNWTCQLCRAKTPRRLKGTTDPRAPELDHIVPLAAGGAHVLENVQVACRACNSRKGATPLGQGWLVGFADAPWRAVSRGV